MQITINLKTTSDGALMHLGLAFLAECNVEAQAFPIAEQRVMMFKAVAYEMVRRGLNPGNLNKRFIRSVAHTTLRASEPKRRRFKAILS